MASERCASRPSGERSFAWCPPGERTGERTTARPWARATRERGASQPGERSGTSFVDTPAGRADGSRPRILEAVRLQESADRVGDLAVAGFAHHQPEVRMRAEGFVLGVE